MFARLWIYVVYLVYYKTYLLIQHPVKLHLNFQFGHDIATYYRCCFTFTNHNRVNLSQWKSEKFQLLHQSRDL